MAHGRPQPGAASAVWVLDIDGSGGAASLAALEAAHGPLPVTRTVVTSSGRHLWFVFDGGTIPCSVGRVGPGLDVRAEGGYVLVPPSVHPSGHIYRFDGTNDIALAPTWVVRLTQKPKPTISERAIAARDQRRPGRTNAYGTTALNCEIANLANVRAGGRNYALNAVAFRLFQLVAGGELEHDQVIEQLVSACHSNGLIKDDGLPAVMATIRSGARAGMQHPRSRGAL
jgi:Bifunctional DNA primase/polymerase, N-terminal